MLRLPHPVLAATLSTGVALAAPASAQFDAYAWTLVDGGGIGSSTTVQGDLLSIALNPSCDFGSGEFGYAETVIVASGRFRFDHAAVSQACTTFGFGACLETALLVQVGDCPPTLLPQVDPCLVGSAEFNGGAPFLPPNGPQNLSGAFVVDVVDVVEGDLLRILAQIGGLSQDCRVQADFSGLSFTPALAGTPSSLSLSSGGTQTLALTAPQALAGETYWLLGSASGVGPGPSLGELTLPLTVDAYLQSTLAAPNTPPLSASFGQLDGRGEATATFTAPAGSNPALVRLTLYHAYLVLDLSSTPGVPQLAYVSQPTALVLEG